MFVVATKRTRGAPTPIATIVTVTVTLPNDKKKEKPMNLEEMTIQYQQACAKAVTEAIHRVVSQYDVAALAQQGFNVATYLYEGTDFCICVQVGKDDYWGLLKPNTDVSDLNEALQKALDDLGCEVVLNAMFTEDIESTSQIIFWELV